MYLWIFNQLPWEIVETIRNWRSKCIFYQNSRKVSFIKSRKLTFFLAFISFIIRIIRFLVHQLQSNIVFFRSVKLRIFLTESLGVFLPSSGTDHFLIFFTYDKCELRLSTLTLILCGSKRLELINKVDNSLFTRITLSLQFTKLTKVGSLITKDNRRRSPTKAGRKTCPTSFIISDPLLYIQFISL